MGAGTLEKKTKAQAKHAKKAVRAQAKQVEAKAEDLAARVRDSEGLARAQAKAAQLAAVAREKLVEAELDEKAAALAAAARGRIAEAELDEKAAELAHRVMDSDAAEAARRLTGQGWDKLGAWLVASGAASRLGIMPKRRRWTGLLIAAGAFGAGYAAGMLTAPKRGDQTRDDLAAAADRLAGQAADTTEDLVDTIRTRLGEDPRTSAIPRPNVNVADGTVFIRGTLPAGFDEDTIRAVVSAIPGVRDVDVKMSTPTA